MRGKRLWQTLRLFTILSATKRTQYYKDHNIFHSMGDNCLIMDRKVPLYAKLISLGNNVQIASNVHFNTHDITHLMLNNMKNDVGEKRWFEKIGCIEVGDNVFIGAGTSINYNVKIGSNVIIGACSLITKDVPDNCVVAGVPARIISSIQDYLKKRDIVNTEIFGIGNEEVTPEAEGVVWASFNRNKRGCLK